MRLEETEAAKKAIYTRDEGGSKLFMQHLYSSASDPKQSVEGEI
jgi:hypothetical protein